MTGVRKFALMGTDSWAVAVNANGTISTIAKVQIQPLDTPAFMHLVSAGQWSTAACYWH